MSVRELLRDRVLAQKRILEFHNSPGELRLEDVEVLCQVVSAYVKDSREIVFFGINRLLMNEADGALSFDIVLKLIYKILLIEFDKISDDNCDFLIVELCLHYLNKVLNHRRDLGLASPSVVSDFVTLFCLKTIELFPNELVNLTFLILSLLSVRVSNKFIRSDLASFCVSEIENNYSENFKNFDLYLYLIISKLNSIDFEISKYLILENLNDSRNLFLLFSSLIQRQIPITHLSLFDDIFSTIISEQSSPANSVLLLSLLSLGAVNHHLSPVSTASVQQWAVLSVVSPDPVVASAGIALAGRTGADVSDEALREAIGMIIDKGGESLVEDEFVGFLINLKKFELIEYYFENFKSFKFHLILNLFQNYKNKNEFMNFCFHSPNFLVNNFHQIQSQIDANNLTSATAGVHCLSLLIHPKPKGIIDAVLALAPDDSLKSQWEKIMRGEEVLEKIIPPVEDCIGKFIGSLIPKPPEKRKKQEMAPITFVKEPEGPIQEAPVAALAIPETTPDETEEPTAAGEEGGDGWVDSAAGWFLSYMEPEPVGADYPTTQKPSVRKLPPKPPNTAPTVKPVTPPSPSPVAPTPTPKASKPPSTQPTARDTAPVPASNNTSVPPAASEPGYADALWNWWGAAPEPEKKVKKKKKTQVEPVQPNNPSPSQSAPVTAPKPPPLSAIPKAVIAKLGPPVGGPKQGTGAKVPVGKNPLKPPPPGAQPKKVSPGGKPPPQPAGKIPLKKPPPPPVAKK
jgi:hypothetical protein